MTSVQLATISTALWVVATVALFIVLANWSTGGSWGLTASIVRGVRGWSDLDVATGRVTSAEVDPFRPILDPYALLRRSHDVTRQQRDAVPRDSVPVAPEVEIIELGQRRIRGG
jgi:hypothetical protein